MDSDSEIKIEESNAKAVKKKTGKEKLSEPEKIEENGDICSRDIGINSQNSKPVSVDDFERLVSATPNNSKPWIAYINFVLQVGSTCFQWKNMLYFILNEEKIF